MSGFILDCSLALTWCFADEGGPAELDVLKRLEQEQALAPDLWRYEIANALLTAERRGRLQPADTEELLTFLDQLDIELLPVAPNLDLARKHRLTAYDGAYLTLAMSENMPLATLDRDLAKAAKNEGVPLLIG